MTEIDIRPLKTGDIDALVKLAHEIWHAHYPGIISREQIDYMLTQRYSPRTILATFADDCWLGAWLKGEIIGFAHALSDATPHTWKLDKLYVHQDFQRRGIGKALLDSVVRKASSDKARRLILRVNRHNLQALAAYAKYGFKIHGQDVLDIGHGFVMDDYLLELRNL